MPHPASDLDSIRKQIGELDQSLLALLDQRVVLTRNLYGHQQDLSSSPMGNPEPNQRGTGRLVAAARSLEQTVQAYSKSASGPFTAKDRSAVLRHIASLCLGSVKPLQAGFLGPKYSYSHLAAIKFFGDATDLIPMPSIESVFEAVERGEVETGIVPIENSTDGRVVDTLGMFVRRDMEICGEVLLPIHHCLLSQTPREEITEVQSKPQALSQCRGWLARHLPSARIVEVSSTTTAAQAAAKTPGVAAIASEQAGREYGLNILESGIADNPNNVTRFAVLGRERMAKTGDDKTAILFQVNHQPGALADAMTVFKEAGLNLTWIESFPSLEVANEYLFFIELTGHRDDDSVALAVERLSKDAQRLTILGSYAKALQ